MIIFLGVGFGLGIVLILSRLVVGFIFGLVVLGMVVGVVIGLVVIVWVVNVCVLLYDCVVVDCWMGEVMVLLWFVVE